MKKGQGLLRGDEIGRRLGRGVRQQGDDREGLVVRVRVVGEKSIERLHQARRMLLRAQPVKGVREHGGVHNPAGRDQT